METRDHDGPDLPQLNRRGLLSAFGGVAALTMAGLLSGCGGDDDDDLQNGGNNGGGSATDINVLNFALNLEYLEAEFYSFATTGQGISANLTGGVGTAGPTTGRQVALSGTVLQVAQELAADELAHVNFLRQQLGGQAIAKPAINLNALGLGFANEAEFLTLSRAFEDVGVSAYGGAAGLITSKAILEAAARILATEAYHAGNIRLQVVQRGAPAPAVDGLDQPPTANNFFPTDQNGLSVVRTPEQVAAIVRGANPAGGAFFPNGLNGAIR
jgi:hypothetical protein